MKKEIKFEKFDENDKAPLYCRLSGEMAPQGSYIEIRSSEDTIRATYDSNPSDTVTASVYHGHTLQFGCNNNLSGSQLNEIFEDEEFRTLVAI